MRAFVLGVLFLGGLISNAAAQLVYGPVAIKTDVNGVPITVSATSSVTINAVGDKLTVDARILADLVDLQKNFARIVGTFEPPANQCSSRPGTKKSPVVAFKNGSLWPRGDQIVISMRGHIDVWSCSAGRQKSALRWRKRKIAFIRMRIPQIPWQPADLSGGNEKRADRLAAGRAGHSDGRAGSAPDACDAAVRQGEHKPDGCGRA
jgi:hypothetical protein